nr:gelsolin-like protein 1 [Maniola hyperantus]
MELEGVMNLRRIRGFTQKDLKEDKIYYMIDNNSNDSYFWIGRLVPDPEKVINSLNRYIHLMSFSTGRYYTIYRQGDEAPRFLAAFPEWDDRMWQKHARGLQRLQANEEMRSNLIPDS